MFYLFFFICIHFARKGINCVQWLLIKFNGEYIAITPNWTNVWVSFIVLVKSWFLLGPYFCAVRHKICFVFTGIKKQINSLKNVIETITCPGFYKEIYSVLLHHLLLKPIIKLFKEYLNFQVTFQENMLCVCAHEE